MVNRTELFIFTVKQIDLIDSLQLLVFWRVISQIFLNAVALTDLSDGWMVMGTFGGKR